MHARMELQFQREVVGAPLPAVGQARLRAAGPVDPERASRRRSCPTRTLTPRREPPVTLIAPPHFKVDRFGGGWLGSVAGSANGEQAHQRQASNARPHAGRTQCPDPGWVVSSSVGGYRSRQSATAASPPYYRPLMAERYGPFLGQARLKSGEFGAAVYFVESGGASVIQGHTLIGFTLMCSSSQR